MTDSTRASSDSRTDASDARTTAVLFDIDGTLVDSNYAHVDAWSKAFADIGHPVDSWRIHEAIGEDSTLLLSGLLGDEVAEARGDEAEERHSAHYLPHGDTDLHVFARATELLDELTRRGHRVVLATSAPEEELAVLRDLLDVEGALWAVTSSEDAETAKPDPGIVQGALEKAGVDAAQAVMVGDAVWDVEAAGRAGVTCVGVRSGGTSAASLTEAGAVEVWDDVAALLAGLDGSVVGQLR
ncbi:HAD family hydrolase [Frigoribacterium sp. CFBP 13729]|uniref:HAD family hydrolase n=1 Tax=Frigoribacterium sp. CFBP 13729 TaxID=2775293 RepID=UPI001785F002|nr:HAD family hydrolase [Frigoribacterium sp. CFBP 13729]MBD8610205.1 HAD family hydrolase [Frigoribacterium sp. CFBP 13729]